MIQAQQSTTIQSTNQYVVQLRLLELTYFSSFFTTFGIQAAVLGASVINGVAMCPVLPGFCIADDDGSIYEYPNCILMQHFLCWSSVICFSLTTSILLSTAYVVIFGQNLALRGPLGSMVRAVNGMVKEQEDIVTIFKFSMISFAMFSISIYWCLMSEMSATISTLITVFGMYFWWRAEIRIRNRFHDKDLFVASNWQEVTDETSFDSTTISSFQIEPTKPKIEGAFSFLFSKKTPQNPSSPPFNSEDNYSNSKHQYSNNISVLNHLQKWEQRYAVVKNSELNFYKDKISYYSHPKSPIRKRPIPLVDFDITLETDSIPYKIVLTPTDPEDDRSPIVLGCLTQGELANWVDVLCQSKSSKEPQD